MKIISINVVAFGKLKDVTIQLKDGINVSKNVNSFGKTTLASFIRAMLYGFTYTRTKGVTDAARFAPWGGVGLYGGSMVVEQDGVTYRIERFFGATARQETLKITNDKTGKPIAWDKQPGEVLLGLTADSYDRSAYFPQEAVELSSNENLDSRLANLVQNGAEDYEKVQDKLREYKKNLRHERGVGGEIARLEQLERQLEGQLANAQNAEKRAAEIDRRLGEIATQTQTLMQRQNEYGEQQTKLQQAVAQAQPTAEEQRTATRLALLNESLSRIPTEFEQDFKRCDNLARDIAQLREEPQQPQQQSISTSTRKNTVAKIVAAIICVVGAVLAVLGIVEMISIGIGVALGAVCLAGGVALFILSAKWAKQTKQSSQATTASVEQNVSKRDELIGQYLSIASKYVYTDGVDYETVKRSLWEKYKNYEGDVRERNTLLSTVRTSQTDTTQLNEQIVGIQRVLTQISAQLNDLATETGRLSEERKGLVFNSVEVMDKLLTVREERAEAVHRYEIADMVSNLLERAKDNLSSGYLPRLCARCGQLLNEITQNNLSVVVDRNFTVSIRENGQTKPLGDFSRGIREITLLCFRIALSELLYDGAIPFIIIDDAFVNFDEDNFLRATQLLVKLSAHAQVIYFTCHDRLGKLS